VKQVKNKEARPGETLAEPPSREIGFGRTARENAFTFFVRNHRVGFNLTHAGKLFDAFQLLHSAAGFPEPGSGPAPGQGVRHRHSGWLRAESKPSHGATFLPFTLPETAKEQP
jgi:light-regulated signal transduction histidine kinase (bacteriophytochrome)